MNNRPLASIQSLDNSAGRARLSLRATAGGRSGRTQVRLARKLENLRAAGNVCALRLEGTFGGAIRQARFQ